MAPFGETHPPTSTDLKRKGWDFQLGVVGFKSKWWQLKYVHFFKNIAGKKLKPPCTLI